MKKEKKQRVAMAEEDRRRRKVQSGWSAASFGFTNDLCDRRHPPNLISLPISLNAHVKAVHRTVQHPLPSLPPSASICSFFVAKKREEMKKSATLTKEKTRLIIDGKIIHVGINTNLSFLLPSRPSYNTQERNQRGEGNLIEYGKNTNMCCHLSLKPFILLSTSRSE